MYFHVRTCRAVSGPVGHGRERGLAAHGAPAGGALAFWRTGLHAWGRAWPRAPPARCRGSGFGWRLRAERLREPGAPGRRPAPPCGASVTTRAKAVLSAAGRPRGRVRATSHAHKSTPVQAQRKYRWRGGGETRHSTGRDTEELRGPGARSEEGPRTLGSSLMLLPELLEHGIDAIERVVDFSADFAAR